MPTTSVATFGGHYVTCILGSALLNNQTCFVRDVSLIETCAACSLHSQSSSANLLHRRARALTHTTIPERVQFSFTPLSRLVTWLRRFTREYELVTGRMQCTSGGLSHGTDL